MTHTYYAPNPGDLLVCKMFGYEHRGVAMGNGMVLTNTPSRGEHMCSLGEFSGGRPIEIKTATATQRGNAFQNAYVVLTAPKPYDLLRNNCDHTVCKLYGVPPQSEQVNIRILILGFLGIGLFVAKVAG